LGAETVKYVLSRTNKNESVEAFLSEFSAGQKILAGGGHSVPMPVLNVALESSADVSIEKSMSLLNRGEALVRQKKYADAVKVFQDAIAQDPDNMQAYSDLAFAYKKLGDVKHSVEYYEKATATVVQCNRRMNANKSLLFDYSVKASSYYNAGMAREEIAKIYTARGQKQLAADNYAKALKNYQNALYNCQQVDEDSRAIATYETAIARIQAMQSKSKKTTRPQGQKKKGKKLAFDAGAGRVSDSPMPGMTIAQMIELRNSRDMG
ncbi:MAG: tetratricopeptide repeat protein, partial [Alphaproteobacteria bacterium]|nr:tetratricopeptide repeat protein [Alphaproteobacteria bacterium]